MLPFGHSVCPPIAEIVLRRYVCSAISVVDGRDPLQPDVGLGLTRSSEHTIDGASPARLPDRGNVSSTCVVIYGYLHQDLVEPRYDQSIRIESAVTGLGHAL